MDIKRKIVIGIPTTKGKEHIKKTNLTMHHMMTTIKISDQNSDEDNEDSFIAFMALTSFNYSPTSMWILDTNATCHLTSRFEWLKDYKNLEHPFLVRFGSNGVEYGLGHGTAHLELSDGNFIEVNEVYYIPNIAQNLISIHKLTNDNNSSSSTTNIVSFFTRHPVVEVMSLIVQDKYIFTF